MLCLAVQQEFYFIMVILEKVSLETPNTGLFLSRWAETLRGVTSSRFCYSPVYKISDNAHNNDCKKNTNNDPQAFIPFIVSRLSSTEL